MHIFARLEEATLQAILDELLPVTILLDKSGKDGRWVSIQPTHQLDFIAGEGLRLSTSGQIHWIVAGMPVDATLHSAQVMLRPEIAAEKHGGRLVFRPSLESADLKNVPSWMDKGIVKLVNGLLESRADDLFWDFGRTLQLSVAMPPSLVGVSSLQLGVNNAAVVVTGNAFELTLTLGLHFQRPPTAG